MPNYIKYSISTESNSLRVGNFNIGVGDISKGPTNVTGYWNGITPPSDGYTVYLNKENQGPSIYLCNNDEDLINLTKTISGNNFDDVAEAISWLNGQSESIVVNKDYETIITEGLVLNLDASFIGSYSRSGNNWIDLSGNGNNMILVNGATFNSDGIVFNGTNQYVITEQNRSSLDITNQITLEVWLKSTALANSLHGDCIFSKGLSSDNNSGVYELLLTRRNDNTGNDPLFRMRLGQETKSYTPSDIPIELDKIYHIVCTYDSNIIRTFINGTQSGIGLSASGNIESNNQELTIGARWLHQNTSVDSFYSGSIYTTRIYNRSLTEEEIIRNYNSKSTSGVDGSSGTSGIDGGVKPYVDFETLMYAGWSTRAMLPTSPTNIMRLRRSDFIESNFSESDYINGNIASWASNSNIYLTSLYQQVNEGASFNLKQTTVSSQPVMSSIYQDYPYYSNIPTSPSYFLRSDVVTVNYSNIGNNGNFSVSIWAKGYSRNRSFAGLFNQWSPTGTSRVELDIDEGDRRFFRVINSNLTATAESFSNFSTNTWQHYVGVFSSQNYIKLYANGVQIATSNHNIVAPTITNNIGIMIRADFNSTYKIEGQSDDIVLFNEALTATQVLELYNSTKSHFGIT